MGEGADSGPARRACARRRRGSSRSRNDARQRSMPLAYRARRLLARDRYRGGRTRPVACGAVSRDSGSFRVDDVRGRPRRGGPSSNRAENNDNGLTSGYFGVPGQPRCGGLWGRLVEVPVDGGAGDAELGSDLVDGVAAPSALIEFVIHGPGRLHLPDALSRKICSHPAAVSASVLGLGMLIAGGDPPVADSHACIGNPRQVDVAAYAGCLTHSARGNALRRRVSRERSLPRRAYRAQALLWSSAAGSLPISRTPIMSTRSTARRKREPGGLLETLLNGCVEDGGR